jgi:uncharacterized protein YgbK (DUF1537 family)
MAVGPISAVGLSQDVLSSSNSDQQEALQTLQNSLSSGNLTIAQSAFQALQSALQNSSTASGSLLSNDSQLNTDLTALGNAINSGDLSTAQSALATVLGDLKSTASAAATNEANAASQSLQLVEGILSQLNTGGTASTSTDNTTSILQSYYGGQSGLNVIA